jgi:mercuric ion transport protein
MPNAADRLARRRLLPSGLTGLAGLACAACCAIPFLLAAGVLGGAGWAALGQWMPGVAIILTVLAAGAWWWASRRRHSGGCAGGRSCGCGAPADHDEQDASVRSDA